jgi:uncharacterized protein
MERVRAELAADPGPDAERITTAFWAACGGGHEEIAALLLAEGADMNWVGWSDETPLDLARKAEAPDLVAWLLSRGARTAAELG